MTLSIMTGSEALVPSGKKHRFIARLLFLLAIIEDSMVVPVALPRRLSIVLSPLPAMKATKSLGHLQSIVECRTM